MTRHKLRKNAATHATKVIIAQKNNKNNSLLKEKYITLTEVFTTCKIAVSAFRLCLLFNKTVIHAIINRI